MEGFGPGVDVQHVEVGVRCGKSRLTPDGARPQVSTTPGDEVTGPVPYNTVYWTILYPRLYRSIYYPVVYYILSYVLYILAGDVCQHTEVWSSFQAGPTLHDDLPRSRRNRTTQKSTPSWIAAHMVAGLNYCYQNGRTLWSDLYYNLNHIIQRRLL